MIGLRRLLMQAATRLAANPRMRAKAGELYEREVKPRARAAWDDAKPTVEAAKKDLREAAAAADPRSDPVGFAKQLKKRFIDDPR